MSSALEKRLYGEIRELVKMGRSRALDNLAWLQKQMHPYFSITMQDQKETIFRLATNLQSLADNNRLILADSDKSLVVACLNRPGSLYETLKNLQEKEISYAQIMHSSTAVPGLEDELEVQRFDFDRKDPQEIDQAEETEIPARIKRDVSAALKRHYPAFDFKEFAKLLRLLWLNNEKYVRLSPAKRIAQVLWLFSQGKSQGGIYLDVEETEGLDEEREYRILFAAGNPPQKDFLLQTLEVFNRLDIGIKRAYCLTINTGIHPYFLGTFYIKAQHDSVLDKESSLLARLKNELYNTQILSTGSPGFQHFVTRRVMTGEEASLVNALISFCHTQLAPDPFDYEDVERAFLSHPEMTLQLVQLFRARFDPAIVDRENLYQKVLEQTVHAIEEYNTGHRYIDEIRRTMFKCGLSFIRHTLKTNFFVPEKHALAFRLDPAYLNELDTEMTDRLPRQRPFRLTFFFGRYGAGFHIGFSDIARGGWRTILTKGRDDYVSCATTLFKEVYVLAHTQHLKNKDIYEGGSKMGIILDISHQDDPELVTQRLYKLQYGFINAFFDIFVTREGQAKDPRVIDYYREDEPIELGPDENMHDAMVELIARQSVKREYLLGIGVISSKRVGINHKEYGVTSTGVVKFAEITMQELGIDIHRDPFSVKFTGGPNGDVAGNAMRILLERCPLVKINLIIDGTGALVDPAGANHDELRRILLQQDLDSFEPNKLQPGGFILYRKDCRQEGLRQLFRKVLRTETGLEEQWISLDEFHREYGNLIFSVSSDLFIPAGGRPETINRENWQRFFDQNGQPSSKAIIEGANSFLTPEARTCLQQKGIIIMRDASANKCGVISSSYEIIANLLLSEKEFLFHKDQYVADVLEILEKRAEDEARLIFRRFKQPGNNRLYTEVSEAISAEINAHYARLYSYFQRAPELCQKPLYRKAMLSHLPGLLRNNPKFRLRLKNLPQKYQYAILASEIASSLVYRGDQTSAFEEMLTGHLNRIFPHPKQVQKDIVAQSSPPRRKRVELTTE